MTPLDFFSLSFSLTCTVTWLVDTSFPSWVWPLIPKVYLPGPVPSSGSAFKVRVFDLSLATNTPETSKLYVLIRAFQAFGTWGRDRSMNSSCFPWLATVSSMLTSSPSGTVMEVYSGATEICLGGRSFFSFSVPHVAGEERKTDRAAKTASARTKRG